MNNTEPESGRAQYAYEGEEEALIELEADPLEWTKERHACTGAGSGPRCVCGAHRLDPVHYGVQSPGRATMAARKT